MLRIYEWIGKNISIEEHGINPLEILPVPQNIWHEGSEDIYFYPMYIRL